VYLYLIFCNTFSNCCVYSSVLLIMNLSLFIYKQYSFIRQSLFILSSKMLKNMNLPFFLNYLFVVLQIRLQCFWYIWQMVGFGFCLFSLLSS